MEELIYKKTEQGDLCIRIYRPKDSGEGRPAILFFFGGAWKRGNLDQFKTHSEHLARHGMVAASAEYRVSDRHETTPIECVKDGRSAYRWLKAHAPKFGIDTKRIAVSGGSAGGHVALCVSLAEAINEATDDQAIACDPSLLALFNPVCDATAWMDRFGDREEALSVSPVHLAGSHIPPSTMFYGSEDRMIEEGRELVRLSHKIDVESKLHVADGEKHSFFNRSPWLESTTDMMHRFLHHHGYVTHPSDVVTDKASALHDDATDTTSS